MTDRLMGKRAVVTAAGQGIGRATALAMAADGAEVLATDINAETLATLEADGITTQALDVLDSAAVSEVVGGAGADILFNGAGFVHHGNILEATEEDWAFAVDLNVTSMLRTIKAAAPGMLERGSGSIINVASAASSVIGAPNRVIYGATKGAVIGLTKAVAKDHIAQGLRCNAICPGTVESPSWHDRVRELGKSMGSYEEALKAFTERQPMGRVGSAEEIAAMAVYLASDESAFVTGQAMIIDGGWSG